MQQSVVTGASRGAKPVCRSGERVYLTESRNGLPRCDHEAKGCPFRPTNHYEVNARVRRLAIEVAFTSRQTVDRFSSGFFSADFLARRRESTPDHAQDGTIATLGSTGCGFYRWNTTAL